jgi:class 3 adenylate cyclase
MPGMRPVKWTCATCAGKLGAMICPACAATNDADARFCKACGRPLSAQAPERRKLVTSVFCDLSGSTALAERLDAEAVFRFMARYFDGARRALEGHGGLVEKFIGDAVVGMFGVPEANEDDALRACRAALEIQERVAELNAEYEQSFETGIAVRIGLNTGEVVTGALGAGGMFVGADAVVLGDAVNVAARLEQAAPPGQVLIGESTYRLVRHASRVEAVAPVEAKGKSAPLVAYRLLGVKGPGAPALHRGNPFAGRERELAILERAFDAVESERCCRLVTLVGEPGVGKSRLAAELVERVGARARAVRGACLSYGEGITYWAVGQIVRDLAGIRDDHSPETARAHLDEALADSADAPAVAALLAQLLGLGTGATTPGELAWAVRRFLAVAAADRPLVLIVDDIQWGERILLDLVAGLPHALSDSPILIVCLARPELRGRAPEWEVTIGLEGLATRDVDELLGSLGAPATLRGRLTEVSAGNPLFAEELVAMLAEQGALQERDLDRIDLPLGLNGILNARLDRLEGRARDALERGAIEGEVFHRGAVVELSAPGARSDVPSQLVALSERDFVYQVTASIAADAAFRFKHLLVREAAYHATAKKLRATLHEQFAVWLERVAGDRANEFDEILGYHLEQAFRFLSELGPIGEEARGLGERAAVHLVAAARHAAALSDFEAAAGMLRRGLALGLADPRDRLRVQFEFGHALHQTRRVAESIEVLTETHERAVQLGEEEVAALSLVQRTWNLTGDPSFERGPARAVAEQAIEVLTKSENHRGLVLARRLRAHALRGTDITAAGVEYEKAFQHAQACGDKEMLRLAIGSLANQYLSEGPVPAGAGIERCESLLEAVRGDRVLEATVKRPLALLYAMTVQPAEAIRLVQEAGHVLDELDLRTAQVYRRVAAYALELVGDLDSAEQELEAILAYFRALRPDQLDTRARNAMTELVRLYCDQGRWEEAAALSAQITGAGGKPFGASAGREKAAAARLAAHHGSSDALIQAEEAVGDADRHPPSDLTSRALIWLALAEVQATVGQATDAEASLAQAVLLFDLKGNSAGATAAKRRSAPVSVAESRASHGLVQGGDTPDETEMLHRR